MEQVVTSVYRRVQINDSTDKQISTARTPKTIFKIYPWSLSHGRFVSNYSGSILALLYPETSTPKLWEMSKWFGSLDFLLPKCRCRWVLNFSAWAFRKRGNKSLQLEFHHSRFTRICRVVVVGSADKSRWSEWMKFRAPFVLEQSDLEPHLRSKFLPDVSGINRKKRSHTWTKSDLQTWTVGLLGLM